jgi:hypothetical protein
MTLLDDWLEADLGDRLDRTNALAEHPSDEVPLGLDGYAETIRHRGWEAKLDPEPYEPLFVFEIEDQILGRLDTAGAALALGVDSDDTSLIVATDSGRNVWINSTDRPQDFPFCVQYGGEVGVVTAISGTTSPQTFTVTRSHNGVVKSHLAGTDVRIARVAP